MATDLEFGKGERPLESVLRLREAWFRCGACGRTFGRAEGLRSHRRFGRCPGIRIPAGTDLNGSSLPGDVGFEPDPLDNPELRGDALRKAVTQRLRYLAGESELP